jgi:hypothetical protein
MVPYELLQDLNRLVCSSKNKKIESLFIKLASVDQDDFYDWILKNSTNAIIKRGLNFPNSLSALEELIINKDEFNNDPNKVLLTAATAAAHGTPTYLGFYFSLSYLIDKAEFETILRPFYEFLHHFNTVGNSTPEEIANVENDLSSLHSQYEEEVLEEERLEEERLEEESRIHHERISREEMLENNPGGSTHHQMRKIATYRFAFGYLAQNWTNLIKDHIQRQNSPEYWSGVMDILNSNRLHRTGDVISSLPYVPDMRDSGSKLAQIFARIPTYFQTYGEVAAYNLVNRDIFSALKMPMAQQTGHHQDDTDYSAFYESGRDPNPDESISYNNNEEEELDEMASEDVLECSFIFSATIILAQIEELIKQH